jgi:tRNA-binding protein
MPFHTFETVLYGSILPPTTGVKSQDAAERMLASYDDFAKLDIRVGRVVSAREFPEARKPAYKLEIDFGPLGIRRSSAQITQLYSPEELVGRLVVAVVNFPPKQIGPFLSEVLVLGAMLPDGGVVLLAPDRDVPLGSRIA